MKRPDRLPLLEFLCWDLKDPYNLSEPEMLSRYERGWRHKDMVSELTEEERNYIRYLADAHGGVINV